MSIIHRRILFIVFIIIFFVLVPAVSFYAAGYDFNFQSGKMQSTSILTIKTKPEKATINLGDGKKFNWLYNFLYGEKNLLTPRRIRNLLPGEYNLKIRKDGYYDYERKIKLKPRQALVLDDIILFKKSTPLLEIKGSILAEKLSPDETKLAILTEEKVIIINLTDSQKTEIPIGLSYSSRKFNLLWAPSNKKIILAYGDYPVINIENGRTEASIAQLAGNIQTLKWDLFSDNKVYISSSGSIKEVDISLKKSNKILKEKIISDFLVKDGNIYIFNGDRNLLEIFSLNNQQLIKSIALPAGKNYKFINYGHSLINLLDQKNNILYLINPWSLLPIQDSITNFKDGTWFKEDKILYWNDFEIWIYDANNRNKNLLTRISSKINKAIKYPEENYVVYATDKNIKVIEFNKNYNETFAILDFTAISSVVITPNGDNIYFQKKIGESKGLYRLEVK